MGDRVELILSIASTIGLNGILLFLIKRFFDRRDKQHMALSEKQTEFYRKIETGLETLRLLSYARMSQEIERLLNKGFATPAERRILNEMYKNYKEHGWNGDMDARLSKVYLLRTDHAPHSDGGVGSK